MESTGTRASRALPVGGMTTTKVAAVFGVGPGLGAAVARRFAREQYAVALLARGEEGLREVHAEIVAEGGRAAVFPADASDARSVSAALSRVRAELGAPEVLVYNAGAYVMGGILELDPAAFESAWRVNCLGALFCAREVLPAMLERGRGTLLLTGATASLRGSARFAGLAVGKFGLRALGQSLAREFGPRGIHVAHVIIDGQIDTPRVRSMVPGRDASTLLSPEAIAETYWQLHQQHPSAWTQELDLRPAPEKF
jgi:NAD(P)-dependent dehydrogenase (short-subunit alcohol dehydrogenase family)